MEFTWRTKRKKGQQNHTSAGDEGGSQMGYKNIYRLCTLDGEPKRCKLAGQDLGTRLLFTTNTLLAISFVFAWTNFSFLFFSCSLHYGVCFCFAYLLFIMGSAQDLQL
ncbi:hypothetical protein QBC37DRAFT_418435, partial [Rhypophila decipiens]